MKNIAFLIYTKFPSGGLKVIFRVGNELLNRGHKVIFYIAESETDFKLEFKNKVPIVYSPKKIAYRLFSRLAYLFKISVKADVIISTYFPTAIAATFNRKIKGEKFYYVQAYEPHFFSFRLLTFFRRVHYYLLARASYLLKLKYIVNCEGSAIGPPQNRIVGSIPPGIDLSIYHSNVKQTNGTLVIGHIGRAERRKGSLEFFTAIKELQQEGLEFEVLVAYNKWEDKQGVIYKPIYPSNENELADFYRQCDIVVSTVWEKGFAYPPLESMACGAISISTPIDYGQHWVDHIPIAVNSPNEIKNAIRWYVENPEKINAMRLNGFKTAQMYSWENVVNLWENVLSNEN